MKMKHTILALLIPIALLLTACGDKGPKIEGPYGGMNYILSEEKIVNYWNKKDPKKAEEFNKAFHEISRSSIGKEQKEKTVGMSADQVISYKENLENKDLL